MSALDRLVRSYRVDEAGCWVWQKRLMPTGYGTTTVGSRKDGSRGTMLAHRLAYLLLVGPIPDGLELDHLCRNRACVNPAHLEPVTHRENVKRSDQLGKANANKTHCKHGHPFDAANTLVSLTAQGGYQRHCRACGRIQAAARRSGAA